MKINNQRKADLKPFYTDSIKKPLDQQVIEDNLKAILNQCYQPLVPGQPVIVEDDQGNPIDQDDVASVIYECCLDFNPQNEQFVNNFWKQALHDYLPGLNATSVFISQANARLKTPMPLPSANVIYTSDDIKDGADALIQTGEPEKFIVNTAFTMPDPYLGFWFISNVAWNQFKNYVTQMTNAITQRLSTEAIQKFTDFQNTTVNDIEGLLLRSKSQPSPTADLEYSFERLIVAYLLEFTKQNPKISGAIVPYIDELIIPDTVLLFNVEQIDKMSKTKFKQLVADVNKVIKRKYKLLNLKTVSKLSTAVQQQNNQQAVLANHRSMLASSGKRANKLFKFGKQPEKRDIVARIVKLIEKQSSVAMSENYQKCIKKSYQRANRREPDNPDRQGVQTGLKYYPDIHIYLDCSGSISEPMYAQAIKTCIKIAKRVNCNLYFNSFADDLTQTVKVQTRGISTAEAYKKFLAIPKTNGGTEFQPVWDYILSSEKRKKEISLMITDFGYWAPSYRVKHPAKLYYIPIDVTADRWPSIVNWANEFCQSMYHIDSKIRKHLLM